VYGRLGSATAYGSEGKKREKRVVCVSSEDARDGLRDELTALSTDHEPPYCTNIRGGIK
jgi:hypothetical protein